MRGGGPCEPRRHRALASGLTSFRAARLVGFVKTKTLVIFFYEATLVPRKYGGDEWNGLFCSETWLPRGGVRPVGVAI